MTQLPQPDIECLSAEFRLLFARIPAFAGDVPLRPAEAPEIVSRLAQLCGELSERGVLLREMGDFASWFGKQMLFPAAAVRQSATLEPERLELLTRVNGWIPRAANPHPRRNSAKVGRHERPIEDAAIAADVGLLRTPGLSLAQAQRRHASLRKAGKPLPRNARNEVAALMKRYNLSESSAEIAALMKLGRFTETEAEVIAQELHGGASAKHAVDRSRRRRRQNDPD